LWCEDVISGRPTRRPVHSARSWAEKDRRRVQHPGASGYVFRTGGRSRRAWRFDAKAYFAERRGPSCCAPTPPTPPTEAWALRRARFEGSNPIAAV